MEVLAMPTAPPAEVSGRRRKAVGGADTDVTSPTGVRPDVVAWVALIQLTVVVVCYGALLAAPRFAASAAAVVAVTNIALLMRLRGNRQVSLGSVFLAVYAMFHVGLTPYVVLGVVPELLTRDTGDPLTWLMSPQIPAALTLVTISMSAFMFGYALVASRRRVSRHSRSAARAADRSGSSVMVWVGPILLLIGAVLLLGVVLSEGVGSLGADNFASFRTDEYNPRLAWASLFLGIGMAVLGTSGRSGGSHWWALAFLPLVAIPLAIGLRSATIFPLAAFLVAWARRHRVRVRLWHGAVILALLTLGSVIRQAREGGTGGFRLTNASLNPLDGLAELSATLRTVVVVREWRQVENQPYVGWETYWAPVERLIGRFLGLDIAPAALDDRNLSTAFLARPELGPIGGSPTAEAYRAAGVVGVVVVLALMGALIAHLDGIRSGSIWEYAVGMVGYVLLVWSRNNVTPVVAQAGLCVAIILVARWVGAQRPDPVEDARLGRAVPGRTGGD
ncbi:O-antigen polysaccharide polymerase Wzy [Micromonospora sp. NPDC051227]|uniref:O-antigen polysaccharide polymerase Wzy n=1 Tax=Micromonospora sp. NPDC051227 TaxID=3364285 RepID=UPI001933FA85|nr:O-antigen polysaccharide polymerase Wzy [Micromonospora sp. STR1s_5]